MSCTRSGLDEMPQWPSSSVAGQVVRHIGPNSSVLRSLIPPEIVHAKAMLDYTPAPRVMVTQGKD
jgi:hypothetical protein